MKELNRNNQDISLKEVGNSSASSNEISKDKADFKANFRGEPWPDVSSKETPVEKNNEIGKSTDTSSELKPEKETDKKSRESSLKLSESNRDVNSSLKDKKSPEETVKYEGAKNGFKYEHNPLENPKVMKDAVYDPNTVYGFRPDPNSARIGRFSQEKNELYDWTDPDKVAKYKETRIQYHKENDVALAKVDEMKANGCSIEEIGRFANHHRNEVRLERYIKDNDMDGLAAAKASNMENFGNKFGMTAEQAYEKYGSWEKVTEKSLGSTNAGMDACCGLHDEFYYMYPIEEDKNG